MTGKSVVSNPTAASAPPHEVQVDKCEDEDKTHEVNSEVKVSDILKERIGKICYAHKLIIIELMYFMYNDYYLYNLIIDIRATDELHNESEEAKGDDKVDVGKCEVSESRSKILGKTSCVVCITVYTYLYLSHTIVN